MEGVRLNCEDIIGGDTVCLLIFKEIKEVGRYDEKKNNYDMHWNFIKYNSYYNDRKLFL